MFAVTDSGIYQKQEHRIASPPLKIVSQFKLDKVVVPHTIEQIIFSGIEKECSLPPS
jgi:hypothetical protein